MVEQTESPHTTLQENHEKQPLSRSPLLVFGQGPVIAKDTRQVPSPATEQGQEDVNFWSDDLAKSAAILSKTGQVSQIVVMGGRTGGGAYLSEAELIKQHMHSYGISDEAILTETQSNDTLENLINMLNIRDDKGENGDEFNILGTDFHVPRIRILMQLFNLKIQNSFSSEEVLMLAARIKEHIGSDEDIENLEKRTGLKPEDIDKLQVPSFQDLNNMLNMNDQDYYKEKKGLNQDQTTAKVGQEARDFTDRRIKDDLWTRELLERPESWLGTLVNIKNPERRRAIVKHAELIYGNELKDRFGIDTLSDSDEILLDKLANIHKNPLTPEQIAEWENADKTVGWAGSPAKERLEKLLAESK